jgi:signal transduction histidine kinase
VELLHDSHPPQLSFANAVPTCVVTAREGAVQALVEHVVRTLAADNVVVETELDAGRIAFTFAVPSRSSAGNNDLIEGPLWQFLAAEFPNLRLKTTDTQCQVQFDLLATPGSALAAAALVAFQGSTDVDAAESEALAHLLHDLKNRLVAFHLALAQPHSDRTARLKAQLDASQHVDASLLLCESISTIRSALVEPEIERLDIGRFFRDYVAEKYATLPATIDIEAPGRADGIELTTSSRYLRSMLDNLIKNAVEAMPSGGRIRCDWVADMSESRLLIEVSDNGRGMSADEVESLLAGRGLPSRKDAGTGVGMMTVVAMVGRLGGTISGESQVDAGTRWIIELPAVEEPLVTVERNEANAHPVG